MTIDSEMERQVKSTLDRYCNTFDGAQFEVFAALFERGRWFMVPEPGSKPVLEWIHQYVVLYEGRPLTRHEVSNLVVTGGSGPNEAVFRCAVGIWQQFPEELPRLLTRVRFSGTFRLFEDGWWWHTHVMDVEQAGDLRSHIKGGHVAIDPPGGSSDVI